jgi:hypothetical protein
MRSRLLAVTGLLVMTPATQSLADDDPNWASQLVARADDIATKVATLRGLPIKRPIDKGVMTDAQLRDRILLRTDEDSPPAERAADAAVAKRWGLVPMAVDLDKLLVDLLTEQIAGFYDPTEAKLYISAKPTPDGNWADMVMAHEITHALQDQHFGLEKWMRAVKDNGDASTARQALVEGDGVALMIEYILAGQGMGPPWDHDEVVRMMTSNMDGSGGGELLDAAPIAIRQGMLFPYKAGIGFVAALRRGQPWTNVDAVFKRPPRSTEQVIHPALYLADARPDEISTPTTGDPPIDTAVWGEEGWREFLVAHGVVDEMAASASAGWGGDRVILRGPSDGIVHPNRTTGIAMTTWDTDADVLEFWDAAGRALDHLVSGATVSTSPDEVVWLSWDGRVTAIARNGRRVVITTGASVRTWRAVLADAWTWKVAWAKR